MRIAVLEFVWLVFFLPTSGILGDSPDLPTLLPLQRFSDSDAKSIAENRVADDVRFLASEDMRGRGPGGEGIDRAAEMISQRFAELQFDTHLFEDSPYQVFGIPGTIKTSDSATNAVRIERNGATLQSWSLDENFRPLALGRNGRVDSELVFVGYGITAKSDSFEYDDYAGIDVKNKVVVILRKEPQQSDPNGQFEGTKPSVHAYFASKVSNAITHGAIGVVFINDHKSLVSASNGNKATSSSASSPFDKTASENSWRDPIPGTEDAGLNSPDVEIPVWAAKRSLIDELIASNSQSIAEANIKAIEEAIDSDVKPHSFLFRDVRIVGQMELKPTSLTLKNVVATLPGQGALANECIVIGAHYDHVGMGGPGSLSPGIIAVHNGADDNASGTAGLLEIAYRLAHSDRIDSVQRRRIVLIAFSGEERGLLGSRHYVKFPRFTLESTVAMVNLDMIGRLSDQQLIVYGTGTANGFSTMIDRLAATQGFRVRKQPEGLGPSDHMPFYERKVPVLHWFTGLHTDYHRPSDDFEKINTAGIVAITDMVYQAALELSTIQPRPNYQSVTGRADIRIPIQRRPRLGIRMRFDQDRSSVFVEAVADNSPAAVANLQINDRLISIDGKLIEKPEDVIDGLSSKQIGQTATIEIERENQKSLVKIELVE